MLSEARDRRRGDDTDRYPPLVITSLPPAPSSIGAGARRGFRSFLRPQVGHCGRAGHVVLRDGRAHQVEADDVIAQIGAKFGRDRLRDFDGRKLDRALPNGMRAQRRDRDAARRSCGRGIP